jgi:hypothetical protein
VCVSFTRVCKERVRVCGRRATDMEERQAGRQAGRKTGRHRQAERHRQGGRQGGREAGRRQTGGKMTISLQMRT